MGGAHTSAAIWTMRGGARRHVCRRIRTAVVVVSVLVSTFVALGVSGGSIAVRDSSYRVGTEADGFSSELTDPTGMPPGITNGPCIPAAAHPFPVVLVHGTFANENFSWQALAPMLADAGYCVFGLNYGATAFTAEFGNHMFGIDYVENSAAELGAFVSRVLAWTTESDGSHPTAVDMVGHSQGGMMPRYYVEHGWHCPLGAARCTQDDVNGTAGSTRVHLFVGLAPSNHGADFFGLVPVFRAVFGANAYTFPDGAGCGACGEQEAGSPFLTALNGPGGSREAAPGVVYYVVESAYDEVVTPAPNTLDEALGQWPSAFLHGPAVQVDDIRLQDQCPTDATDHIGIIYDPVALWDTTQALADNGPTVLPLGAAPCPLLVPPIVSG